MHRHPDFGVSRPGGSGNPRGRAGPQRANLARPRSATGSDPGRRAGGSGPGARRLGAGIPAGSLRAPPAGVRPRQPSPARPATPPPSPRSTSGSLQRDGVLLLFRWHYRQRRMAPRATGIGALWCCCRRRPAPRPLRPRLLRHRPRPPQPCPPPPPPQRREPPDFANFGSGRAARRPAASGRPLTPRGAPRDSAPLRAGPPRLAASPGARRRAPRSAPLGRRRRSALRAPAGPRHPAPPPAPTAGNKEPAAGTRRFGQRDSFAPAARARPAGGRGARKAHGARPLGPSRAAPASTGRAGATRGALRVLFSTQTSESRSVHAIPRGSRPVSPCNASRDARSELASHLRAAAPRSRGAAGPGRWAHPGRRALLGAGLPHTGAARRRARRRVPGARESSEPARGGGRGCHGEPHPGVGETPRAAPLASGGVLILSQNYSVLPPEQGFILL